MTIVASFLNLNKSLNMIRKFLMDSKKNKHSLLDGAYWNIDFCKGLGLQKIKIKLETYGYYSLFVDDEFVCEGSKTTIIIEIHSKADESFIMSY